MFTYRGDAVPIYNVGGRPVFPEIFGAALFVIGLLICLWRWKRPAYALMLIWFFISLIPAMVTPFSPNFVRTIAVVAGAVCVRRDCDERGCAVCPAKKQSAISIQHSALDNCFLCGRPSVERCL